MSSKEEQSTATSTESSETTEKLETETKKDTQTDTSSTEKAEESNAGEQNAKFLGEDENTWAINITTEEQSQQRKPLRGVQFNPSSSSTTNTSTSTLTSTSTGSETTTEVHTSVEDCETSCVVDGACLHADACEDETSMVCLKLWIFLLIIGAAIALMWLIGCCVYHKKKDDDKRGEAQTDASFNRVNESV